jgi:hypothetical protein
MEGAWARPTDVCPELRVLFENRRRRCVGLLAARALICQLAHGGNAVLPELKEQRGKAAAEQLRRLCLVPCQHHPPAWRTLVGWEFA